MKRILSLAALCGALCASPTLAADLAIWTFEVSVPTNAGPHAAEGGLYGGSATGFHSDGGVVYSNPVGNGSLESFSSNFWSAGDYYQFHTSTADYEDIVISFDQTRSNTGPGSFRLEYSTDGTNFTTISDYTVNVVTWSSLLYMPESTFVFNGPAGMDDLADVYIRLTALVAGSATPGTSRVDNVTISGTLIPEPASLALLAAGALLGLRRRIR